MSQVQTVRLYERNNPDETHFITLLLLLVLQPLSAITRDSLWNAFLIPPNSIRVGCHYYWVNENVDPKGVKAALQYMKDNGITLAFLATDIRYRTRWENPWEGETFGKNKFLSKLWWKNLRTALKTASELDIEMGIFNCPSWSQSGGPTITPYILPKFIRQRMLNTIVDTLKTLMPKEMLGEGIVKYGIKL